MSDYMRECSESASRLVDMEDLQQVDLVSARRMVQMLDLGKLEASLASRNEDRFVIQHYNQV